jgi:hypothetical protein
LKEQKVGCSILTAQKVDFEDGYKLFRRTDGDFYHQGKDTEIIAKII